MMVAALGCGTCLCRILPHGLRHVLGPCYMRDKEWIAGSSVWPMLQAAMNAARQAGMNAWSTETQLDGWLVMQRKAGMSAW